MKKIILEPEAPLYNYLDIKVMDEPKDGEKRKRCVITCEFGKYDVEQLIKKGMSIDDAMEHYERWLYDVIKVNIADDWECDDGYCEVIAIIKENVARFY